MNVSAIKNYNIPAFKMNENNAGAQIQSAPQPAPIQAPPLEQAPEQFEHQAPQMSEIQNLATQMKTPQLADFKKFKLSQQIMGGALCGVAALGLLSSFSGKKWVRLLFTVPVAGAMAFFGANMLNNAKAMDKIMSLGNNPSGQ